MGLGKNLAKLRHDKKMTLDDLADASGVGRSLIHAIEKRESKTSVHAPKLAKAFGITVDQLLSEDLAESPPRSDARFNSSDPQVDQAIDDLRDLERLDPDTRAKILSDLHNAADHARAIARRATAQAKPASAVAHRRGGGQRSELKISLGDGNHQQKMLPFVRCDDPFSAEPSERERLLYHRIERHRESGQ